MPEQDHRSRHWTTRRGFVAAVGFGGTSLYALWATYGAAPGPLTLLGLGRHADATPAAGESASVPAAHDAHAAHGAPAGEDPGVDREAFRRHTERFIERYRLPDGSVYPRPEPQHDHGHAADDAAPRMDRDAAGEHAHADHVHAHDERARHEDAGHAPVVPAHADHAAGAAHEAPQHAPVDAEASTPIEVPMIVGQWYYLPSALRLDAGQDYRLQMMTMDVSHGASIQFGRGARMLRLRPGRVTEVDLRFHAPGRHLVTCTVYCGAAHDVMHAVIEVV